ncbi:Crp/Fnr family transcriptional regulator [Piscinibacter sp. HJYY11]|uniref:Crp/Fnr family transcriptional regulator n=1 Tax=Piscinibacter sp. HJYY11 TaxID=2801333 RepID=UPI00191F0E83|nr:Crp/Fnr family transcriptional regulator [Piscinibacter sp. HJYY11]MBL0728986.1 Crp/Fnr family transcriptional regulator [Piscinibacter sp. HJYY11]
MDSVRTAQHSVASLLSDSVQALAARGVEKSYPKGTLLIHEGDVGEMLFIVLSGRVKAYSTEDGEREIVYGVYGPGEYIGEMSLDGGPRSASVVTLEPTRCVVVGRTPLREHIANHPDFAFELLARVIRRARMATLSARNMALLDVYGRVVKLLEELAQPLPDGRRLISPRPTHAEMAHRVGCSREMVSRLMKDLEQGGYVLPQGKTWLIQRPMPARW